MALRFEHACQAHQQRVNEQSTRPCWQASDGCFFSRSHPSQAPACVTAARGFCLRLAPGRQGPPPWSFSTLLLHKPPSGQTRAGAFPPLLGGRLLPGRYNRRLGILTMITTDQVGNNPCHFCGEPAEQLYTEVEVVGSLRLPRSWYLCGSRMCFGQRGVDQLGRRLLEVAKDEEGG